MEAAFRMILHYKFLYHIPSEDFHKWPEQKIYFLNFRTGTYDLVLADPGEIFPGGLGGGRNSQQLWESPGF